MDDVYTEDKISKKTCEELSPIFPIKNNCVYTNEGYTVAPFNKAIPRWSFCGNVLYGIMNIPWGLNMLCDKNMLQSWTKSNVTPKNLLYIPFAHFTPISMLLLNLLSKQPIECFTPDFELFLKA